MESSAQNSSFTPFEPTLPEGYELHDDYIIEKVLGEGAFGITYLAKEKMTDYTVVLKENHPSDFAYRDPTTGKLRSKRGKDDEYQWALGSFVNEAKILTRLNHPNIVRVLHSFQALDTAYYVMDYIGDRPLYKAAPAPQELTEEWLLGILRPILNALDYIHSQPEVLLHRDIKPNNIMVDPEGTPVLIDFGAARAVSSNKTQTKVGTKGYAPPEQWSSGTKRGPWTDLYALGATCYYLITGEAPPDSSDRSPDDCYSHLASRPELRERFTTALLASIDKALAMRTTDRWQSAQEWLDELDAEHKRKQEEEHRQKVEAEQQILRELEDEKLKVAAAQAALSAAEKKLKQAETARRSAEKKAKQAETARSTAEEKARQAETARSTAEKKARQAETARYTAEEKARQAETARSTAEKKAKQAETARSTAEEKARLAETARYAAEEKSGVFKFAAYVVGILLAVWLLLGYTDGPVFAIKKDYPTLLRSFLYLPGVDLNKADKYGYTPLYRAVERDRTECVKLLIAAGVDLNKANKYGYTPLYRAAYKGHKEYVEQLIAAGADVNKADNDGETPLYWAAIWGHTECMKLLLAAGANVNTADKDGETPLYWAAKKGHTECVKLLLAAGADVNTVAENDRTPFSVARTEEIKRLLRESTAKNWLKQQNINPEKYNTALLEAAGKGDSKLMSQLLTAGADVNMADETGWTPLRKATSEGHTECVKLLIGAGAGVDMANKSSGYTPLYWAAYYGRTECMKLLLAAGANVNKTDNYGETPLYWAAKNGHTECVKLLLAAKADVNKANKDGKTPLSVAKTEEIKRLLREAAKSRLQQQNITPEKYNTALLEAAEKGNSELLSQLLTAGADVNMANNWGYTPLFWAANIGHTECVKQLIAAKADVNMANNWGETPLYRAAMYGHTECVKQLIAAGADVNMANKYGSTPLYWAAAEGHTECVKQLIAAKADVNKANKEGKTPLRVTGTEEIKRLLRAAGAK